MIVDNKKSNSRYYKADLIKKSSFNHDELPGNATFDAETNNKKGVESMNTNLSIPIALKPAAAVKSLAFF